MGPVLGFVAVHLVPPLTEIFGSQEITFIYDQTAAASRWSPAHKENMKATNPTVVAAAAEKTFDKWWIECIRINARNPNQPISVEIDMRKARQVGDEFELSQEDRTEFTIDDLMGENKDQEITALYDAILSKVESIAAEQGIL